MQIISQDAESCSSECNMFFWELYVRKLLGLTAVHVRTILNLLSGVRLIFGNGIEANRAMRKTMPSMGYGYFLLTTSIALFRSVFSETIHKCGFPICR